MIRCHSKKHCFEINTASLNLANHYKTRPMQGTRRANIQIGKQVKVVQKHHQRTGELTEGTVAAILTNAATHPHGIKVRLESGIVGRVKEIVG